MESSMKIGNPADKPAPLPAANGNAAAAQPATAIPVQADASATIELSNTASTLMTGGATAEFDADKVARVAQAIDNGTFKVDPEAIADKLIANAHEVLGKANP
jgi:negative regulator of flagellin synthesis FlgM